MGLPIADWVWSVWLGIAAGLVVFAATFLAWENRLRGWAGVLNAAARLPLAVFVAMFWPALVVVVPTVLAFERLTSPRRPG